MRVIYLLLLISPTLAQFDFFSRPGYEDTYNSISDAMGMKDAIGLWGKAFRNLITRNRLPGGAPLFPNVRDYTVKPQVSDIEALKNLPHGNDKIINEKFLYALLPPIKGQPAFTTSTPSTTTTKATTTTSATTTTPKQTTTTTKKPTTTTKKVTTTKATTTTTEATTTVEEEIITRHTPKPNNGNRDGPQFTVVFRTRDKEILEAKKEGVEVMETDFNKDKENENTTTEKEDETTTEPKKTTKRTTPKPTTKKPSEPKKAATKQKKEATTTMPKMEEEVLMKNALKQKELDDDDISTTIWTEESTAPSTIEGSGEFAEATEPFLLSQDVTLVAEETTAKTTTTKKPVKAEKKEEKKEKIEKKESKTEKPKTEKKASTKKPEPKKQEQKKADKKPMTSTEVEAQIEKEASEILELLNKPAQDKQQELSRKVLFEKLKVYLSQQESTTTKSPKVTTTSSDVETKKETEMSETTAEPTTVAAKENTTAEAENTTVAINESTTVEPTTTTTEEEVKKTFSVKKSLRIPEAEEEDLKPAFVQEDVPEDNITTTTAETTTFQRASPAQSPDVTPAPGSTVYNLNANSNSDTHPALSNVITPIAGILDGISPILVPLLGSTGQAARARARGIQTYQPTGRDIMADSPGETSIVGFGTQLAREILSPGILKRERQQRERAMAAKIEEARRLKESKSLFATILDVAKTGPPLELPIIPTPKPQVFNPALQALPAAPSAAGATYVPTPPPGYNGPPAPPPPPPPPEWLKSRGFNGAFPDVFKTTSAPEQTKNTPYYPPVLETSTFANDEGYQMGRSGVRSTFQGDSGIQMGGGNGVVLGDPIPEMPEIMIAPADESGASAPAFPGGGFGGGFGGGRKPSASFEDVAGNSKMDTSFITSRRRL